MSIFAVIAARKLTNTPAAISLILDGAGGLFSRNRLLYYFESLIYSYLHRFFKIGVLKILYTIQRKTTVSESLFNQPVACYFFNKRLQNRRFLVDIAKLSRTPFLQEHLETPGSVFMEHICNHNTIKLYVN